MQSPVRSVHSYFALSSLPHTIEIMRIEARPQVEYSHHSCVILQKHLFCKINVTTQPASSSFCRSRLLVSFWGRDKGVAIKSLSDGFKDIFGMLARGGDIPANATESLGPLKRAKPT